MSPFPESPRRNIVFFGETGAGKSSTINFLLGPGAEAASNDSHPCTQVCASYETTLNGGKYTLWDTRGLGEGYSFLRNFRGFTASSEKELKKFLKERHQRREIDLLVYCVSGSKATDASVKYYNSFCAITRQLAAPVVILVTHPEREPNVEEWWNIYSSCLKNLKMEFDDYACITTLPGHARAAESRKKLVDLITEKRPWQPQRNASYFGSPIRMSIPSVPPPRAGGWIRSLFGRKYETVVKGADVLNRSPSNYPGSSSLITKKRCWQAHRSVSYFGSPVQVSIPFMSLPRAGGWIRSLFRRKYETVADGGALNHSPRNYTGSSSARASTGSSSYYTASPGDSMPPSPVIEPPTPCSATAESAQSLQISVHLLGVDSPLESSGEETSSIGSSLYSLFTSPHSRNSSDTDVPLQSCMDDGEDYLMSELPFKHSTASKVVRKKSYATRHGAFGDIWECDLVSAESSRTMVAVKAVKLETDDPNSRRSHEKKLRRELRIWGGLHHRNIVPLLGIVSDFGPLPSMVSPWFCNGSLSHYLGRRRLSISRKHRLLGDIAAGLNYLHSCSNGGIIHGDLHSDNVLIDDDERACLTDFGLSLITEFVGTSYVKSSMCGALQFTDPALVQRVQNSLDHRVFCPTKPCDVYSFGGLLLHVLSQKKPFNGLSFTEVTRKVLAGERPNIPTDESITHKSLMRRCWDREEHKRPIADGLVAVFASK